MSKKTLFSLFSLSVFLLGLAYISGVAAFSQSIVSILMYSIITFLFYVIWKKLRKKERLPYKSYIILFLAKVGNILLLLFIILGGFSYYQNEIGKSEMPLYILSNGKKEVRFQSMIHIGSPSFYEQVKNEIQKAKKEGFVLFYEGVRPGSTGSEDTFNKAMGIKFNKELYKSLSRLYGLTFQDNSKFLELVNNYDFNIDFSLDEIVQFYQEEDQKTLGKKKENGIPSEVQDINTLVIQELSRLNEKELKILVYVNQAILNFLIKNDVLKEKIMNEFGNKELFEVILHKRNELLASEIIRSKYDKIIVTYGLLHFEGVFEILKAQDPNWQILEIKPKYPFH